MIPINSPDVFVLSVRRFIEKAKGNADLIVRKLLFDITTSIVVMSPVGDPTLWKSKAPAGYAGGRFRANWQFGVNIVPSGEIDDVDPDADSNIARLAAYFNTADAMSGNVYYLANNLPYSIPLEYGWSSQAPAGMVRVTVMQFETMLEKAVSEL